MALKLYIRNLWQAADRLGNAILGGSDKEYISSRVYRYRDKNIVALWCYKILNWIEKDHCEKAYADALVGFDPNDAVLK